MLSVDLKEGVLRLNDDVKKKAASLRPYGTWAEQSLIPLKQQGFDRGAYIHIPLVVINYDVDAMNVMCQRWIRLKLVTWVQMLNPWTQRRPPRL